MKCCLLASCWAAGLVVCCLSTPAAADDGGWLSKLNPFKQGDANRGRAALSDEPNLPFGFRKPSMPTMPRVGRMQNGRYGGSQSPSLWERMSSGTRSFFSRTGEMLTPPWMRSDTQASNAAATTARRGTFFQGFRRFGPSESAPPEPSQEVNSVGDFLKLPRVKP